MAQTAKLFTNGGSQAVRLPAEFRFKGTEVNIRKDPVTGEIILSGPLDKAGKWEKFFEAAAKVRPEDVPEGWPWRGKSPADFSDPFEGWAEPE